MSVRGAGSAELWELGSVTIVPPQFISNENRYSDKLKVLIYKCKNDPDVQQKPTKVQL